ncbi:hypothetical protein PUMCH_003954 [Australozyma saopauloensis]|uniref:Uncharacterized protein n=1 Tax=Australozyma saopauloensis TaxID=291208 RepID=A0AAX4HDY0_9ASCO|nr:hypothetical protein PUMCH_003954 [[Candida] saopauloensis]
MSRPKRPNFEHSKTLPASVYTQLSQLFGPTSNILHGGSIRQQSYDLSSQHPSKRQLVRHQRSKLDLIDDTKLTSLPLPPPPAAPRNRRKILGQVSPTNVYNPALDPLNLLGHFCESKLDTGDLIADISQCSENLDDECPDPIILVEDYLSSEPVEQDRPMALFRKESLANFKRKIAKKRSEISAFSNNAPKSALETSKSADCHSNHQREDLEAIFGEIPGSEKLKYCTLCDKPLYEISSILTNASTIRHGHEHETNSRMDLYKELVCSDCIKNYERILNEVNDNFHNLESIGDNTLMSKESPIAKRDVLSILHKLQDMNKTELAEIPKHKKRKSAHFSKDLLERLHNLSNLSDQGKKREDWFPKIRSKVNWGNLQRLLFHDEDV